jgi:hypothetical protein
LKWKMLVQFMDILSLLRPFDIFQGHLVYIAVIWSIFSRVGILYKEKSGNPDLTTQRPCLKKRQIRSVSG